MPNQKFECGTGIQYKNCQNLEYGELGEIVDENTWSGTVITKTYEGFVAVYVPGTTGKAFHSTWEDDCGFEVRLLRKDERIILSN